MAWVTGPLRRFFPFRTVFLAYGEIVAGQIRVTHWQQEGYAPEYLHQLATTFELAQRGSLAWWLMNRKPFCIEPDAPPLHATPFEVAEIRRFALGRIAAHGILNVKASAGTYFSFGGFPGPASAWHIDALRLIAPVLNDLFLAHVATNHASPLDLAALTPRQAEIVRHVSTGADDKTIARSLGIAEKTVRNQLTDVYAQLGIHRRAQLISLLR